MSFDVTKPADNEFIAAGPAEMRENFRALKDDRIVDAGSVQGLTPGNSSGQIPVANGNLCTNLNAEKLGGKLAGDLAAVNHAHAVATGSSNGFMANTDKQKLDTVTAGAQPNQNAFANVLVGTTTIQADSQTDVLELVAGTGITFTPDAANDRLTITGHSNSNDPDANQKAALAGTSGTPSGTNKYVTNSDARLTTTQNAVNATTSINGNAITSIFETDGVTVKKATSATNASIATTAASCTGNAATATSATNANTAITAQEITTTGFSNHISILTGTISHGQTIPLPSGYIQAQCKWFISMNYGHGADTAGIHWFDINCSVDANRVVTCQVTRFFPDVVTTNGNANYMIIGIK